MLMRFHELRNTKGIRYGMVTEKSLVFLVPLAIPKVAMQELLEEATVPKKEGY